MLLIGLTGGIGMGKSTVSRYLAAEGENVIDTDELARELVSPGQPALEEIRAEFGGEVVSSDGTLNRAALATVVFKNPERRARLESILHPRIRAAWLAQAREWRARGEKRAVVVIPLLFETGAEKEFGLTICVACSERTQSLRLRERGWDEREIKNRLAAQRPVAEKMDRADRMIWNESSVEICQAQAGRIFARL